MLNPSSPSHLIEATPRGLYCASGDFYIDPLRRVPRALITHAHSDHARTGMASYLTSQSGVNVLRERIGLDAPVTGIAYGERRKIGDATVSFHPAGHLLGSSQIRVEHKGQVCVVTGDYKIAPDASCEAFESMPCDHLITEATFGLPVCIAGQSRRWSLIRSISGGEITRWKGVFRCFLPTHWARLNVCSAGSVLEHLAQIFEHKWP